jgi:hypothetical protein
VGLLSHNVTYISLPHPAKNGMLITVTAAHLGPPPPPNSVQPPYGVQTWAPAAEDLIRPSITGMLLVCCRTELCVAPPTAASHLPPLPLPCPSQFALYDRIAKKVGVVSGLTLDQFVTGVKETEDLDFVLWLSRMFPGRGKPTHSLLPITERA